MHRIRHLERDRWAILNDADTVVFQGTLRDCEDWLDFRENQPARPREPDESLPEDDQAG